MTPPDKAVMNRDECFRILADHIPDDQIVVAVYTAAFDWIEAHPSPLNYIFTGAMGLASSHALGLAIARPDRRIIILDGDGSLLMNLSGLVTVANNAPGNLIHFVCENGVYEANGSHPIPGREQNPEGLDFEGLARSAGYPHAMTFDDVENFERKIGEVLALEGPVFGVLKVEAAKPSSRAFEYMHSAKIREDFRTAVNKS